MGARGQSHIDWKIEESDKGSPCIGYMKIALKMKFNG